MDGWTMDGQTYFFFTLVYIKNIFRETDSEKIYLLILLFSLFLLSLFPFFFFSSWRSHSLLSSFLYICCVSWWWSRRKKRRPGFSTSISPFIFDGLITGNVCMYIFYRYFSDCPSCIFFYFLFSHSLTHSLRVSWVWVKWVVVMVDLWSFFLSVFPFSFFLFFPLSLSLSLVFFFYFLEKNKKHI